jgi:hypothetical protein
VETLKVSGQDPGTLTLAGRNHSFFKAHGNSSSQDTSPNGSNVEYSMCCNSCKRLVGGLVLDLAVSQIEIWR